MATMTAVVPAARLARLSTDDLIAQYDLAISQRTSVFANEESKHGGRSPKQKRVDRIVEMLSERADRNDPTALAWYAN